MIKFFRKLRQRLLAEGRLGHYLAYAMGEIILVVIGILIALQINNWNDARKDRARELGYLHNIRDDVAANITAMDRYLATRDESIVAAQRIVEHFNGKPIADVSAFNADSVGVFQWKRFYLVDNTYQELIGSGNFALLSNVKIKDGLLDIEAMYRQLKGEEDHFRYDSETLLWTPLFQTTDIEPMMQNFTWQMSKGQAGRKDALAAPMYDGLLRNGVAKNGFLMTILEFGIMNDQMRAMRDRSKALANEIDAELMR